jgi:Fe-S-cluster containining protein
VFGNGNITFAKGSNYVIDESVCYLKNPDGTCVLVGVFNGVSKDIRIPSNVVKIGANAFCQKGVNTVTFEAGSKLKEIGNWAFNQTNLQSITIPNSVEKIGKECFWACNSLTEVTFDSGSKLTEIGAQTFYETRLRNIRIPKSVEKIGTQCFAGGKTDICLICSVEEIRKECFSACPLAEVTFEADSKLNELGRGAFDQSLESILVHSDDDREKVIAAAAGWSPSWLAGKIKVVPLSAAGGPMGE